MVRATFTGKGTRKILLLAHMDTVYPRGMLAQQPFRIEGDRAWGLGIADQHGMASRSSCTRLPCCRAMNFRDYGTLTVLINGDEEIELARARAILITKLGAEHDVGAVVRRRRRPGSDQIRLATSGIGAADLTVRGRASHAGSAPERGVNALYEMAHQVLQARDLSDPAVGLKVNWTLAKAGIVRNMIPPGAQAQADIRVDRVADYDGIEQKLRERIKNKLLPDSDVELDFERRRPPLQATDASRALCARTRERSTASSARSSRCATGPTGRRHRRRFCRAQGQGARGGRLRPARLRRALHQRGIHPDQLHRAAALPRHAHDHGYRAGQGVLVTEDQMIFLRM